jgi:beta-lactamase class A
MEMAKRPATGSLRSILAMGALVGVAATVVTVAAHLGAGGTLLAARYVADVTATTTPEALRAAWIQQTEAYFADLPGRYGVSLIELNGSAVYGTRMDDVFVAASVNKLPMALYAYHLVGAGRLGLDDRWEMLPEDLTDGTGVLQFQAPGSRYAVRELLEVLIRQSDNAAAEMFRRKLGVEQINAYAASLGAVRTRQYDATTPRGLSTPRETAHLLGLLGSGRLLAPDLSALLLADLKTTVFNDRIPVGVPPGIAVAHKIGTNDRAMNDVGIVFASRPYVLAIFTEPRDWSTATRTLQAVSASAYRLQEAIGAKLAEFASAVTAPLHSAVQEPEPTRLDQPMVTPKGSARGALSWWAGLWASLMAIALALAAHPRVTLRMRLSGERTPGRRLRRRRASAY